MVKVKVLCPSHRETESQTGQKLDDPEFHSFQLYGSDGAYLSSFLILTGACSKYIFSSGLPHRNISYQRTKRKFSCRAGPGV